MADLQLIQSKIYEIRGQKVMIDRDLAELYQVTTGNLNKSVQRNIKRFPSDFLFQLTKEEFDQLKTNLIFQNGISSWGGTLKMPYAFTEQGVAMLSGVLKSPRAIEVSINIMDAFVHMRQYLLSHAPKQELEELRKRIEYLEEDISSDRESYEKQFDDLFTAFAKLSAAIQIKQTPLDRVKIEGFKNK